MRNFNRNTCVLLCLFSIFSCEIFAQWGIKGNGHVVRESRSHRGFDGIKVGGSFDVFLRQGNSEKVTIEADENLMDEIVTKVENGILIISIRKGKGIRDAEKLNVFVTLEELEYLSASGASDILAEESIRTDDLEIHASGSADIKLLRLRSDDVSCKASGSSDIRLLGDARTLRASLSGSCDLKAGDFEVEDCYLNLSGSSDAHVYASDSIEGSASGSSDIYCAGNPGRRSVRTSGSSDIHF